MRNMIFKTIFASILGSLFVAPVAHADRQGGGTLKVALTALDDNATEWVRFKGIDGDKVSFEYLPLYRRDSSPSEFTLEKENLYSPAAIKLIRALLTSKASKNWQRID